MSSCTSKMEPPFPQHALLWTLGCGIKLYLFPSSPLQCQHGWSEPQQAQPQRCFTAGRILPQEIPVVLNIVRTPYNILLKLFSLIFLPTEMFCNVRICLDYYYIFCTELDLAVQFSQRLTELDMFQNLCSLYRFFVGLVWDQGSYCLGCQIGRFVTHPGTAAGKSGQLW